MDARHILGREFHALTGTEHAAPSIQGPREPEGACCSRLTRRVIGSLRRVSTCGIVTRRVPLKVGHGSSKILSKKKLGGKRTALARQIRSVNRGMPSYKTAAGGKAQKATGAGARRPHSALT